MDVSCACMSCAYSHERACTSTSRVRAGPSCVCIHEHACASTSRVHVSRVRVVPSVRVR